MSLFVSRLNNDVRLRDLEDLFSKYGRMECKLIKGKGYAFVKYHDIRGAKDAIEALDGAILLGKRIDVSWDTNPKNYPARKVQSPVNEIKKISSEPSPIIEPNTHISLNENMEKFMLLNNKTEKMKLQIKNETDKLENIEKSMVDIAIKINRDMIDFINSHTDNSETKDNSS